MDKPSFLVSLILIPLLSSLPPLHFLCFSTTLAAFSVPVPLPGSMDLLANLARRDIPPEQKELRALVEDLVSHKLGPSGAPRDLEDRYEKASAPLERATLTFFISLERAWI